MHDCGEAEEIADGRVSQFNGRLYPVAHHADTLDGVTGAQYQHRHQQLQAVKSVPPRVTTHRT